MIQITMQNGSTAYIDPARISAIIDGRDGITIIVGAASISAAKGTDARPIIDAWAKAQHQPTPQTVVVASRRKNRG